MARAGVEIDLLLPIADQTIVGPVAAELGLQCDVRCFPMDGEDEREALADLRRYLTDNRPSAVLTNRDRATAVLARVPRDQRPFTVSRVGTNIDARLAGKHLLRRWSAKRELVRSLMGVDALVGVSDGVCQALERLLGDGLAPPIERIYNPIDAEAFARLAATPPAHPWLTSKKTPVVLSVGRLVRAKDYPTLIRAFRLVRNKLDCRLIVLGEGRQRARLQRLVDRLGLAGCVDLPGHAANPFAYMARADLLALSSIFEGNPNVLVEALAVGTACVATDCPSGPSETLADGRYGRLVPPRDPPALAAAILEGLERPPDPRLLREAIQRFDRDAAVAAYLRVLRLVSP